MDPTGKGALGQCGIEPGGSIRASFYREFVRKSPRKTSMITLYPVGSTVAIDHDIPAIVTSITLSGEEHAIRYLCEWWDGLKCVSEWFGDYRVSPGQHGVQPIRVGFYQE
jgi:hypothetical protein